MENLEFYKEAIKEYDKLPEKIELTEFIDWESLGAVKVEENKNFLCVDFKRIRAGFNLKTGTKDRFIDVYDNEGNSILSRKIEVIRLEVELLENKKNMKEILSKEIEFIEGIERTSTELDFLDKVFGLLARRKYPVANLYDINHENIKKMLSEFLGKKIEYEMPYIKHKHKLFTLVIDPRDKDIRIYRNFYKPYSPELAKKNLENIEEMYKAQEEFIKKKTIPNLIAATKARHKRNKFAWSIIWDVMKTKQETIDKLRKIRAKELEKIEAEEKEYEEKLAEFNKVINDFSIIVRLKRRGFVVIDD